MYFEFQGHLPIPLGGLLIMQYFTLLYLLTVLYLLVGESPAFQKYVANKTRRISKSRPEASLQSDKQNPKVPWKYDP